MRAGMSSVSTCVVRPFKQLTCFMLCMQVVGFFKTLMPGNTAHGRTLNKCSIEDLHMHLGQHFVVNIAYNSLSRGQEPGTSNVIYSWNLVCKSMGILLLKKWQLFSVTTAY